MTSPVERTSVVSLQLSTTIFLDPDFVFRLSAEEFLVNGLRRIVVEGY